MNDDLLKRLKSDYAGGYANKRNIKAAITLIEALQAENVRLRAALTPSATTKAAYMGEIDCDCPTQTWRHHVPWTSIKQIMRMILEQAALSETNPTPEAPGMTRPGNVTHET